MTGPRSMTPRAQRVRRRPLKRLVDLAITVPAFVLSLPVQAAIALQVRRKLGSPVLFVQERPGLDGKPFLLRKFRSMKDLDPARGLVSDEDRITPFGAKLRSTSLDELPSLWNVIKGDMSLVGPRPLLLEYLPMYTPEQNRRHEVRPGLTGLAQVSGRNQTSWDRRLALDVRYVEEQSLRLDLEILRRTLSQVVKRSGVTADDHVTMPKLTADIARASAEADESVPEPAAAGLPRVVYGVTVGQTADSLLKGQLSYLRERGWDVHLVASPGDQTDRAVAREGVEFHPIPMTRGITPPQDVVALVRWIKLLLALRPDAVNVGTPKAGLVGSLAAWITRVPKRIYVVRGLRLETESGLKRALLWAMERITIAASTDIIAVSHSLRAELEQARLAPAHKVTVIGSGSSNGVDAVSIGERVAVQDRDALRFGLGINDEDFLVGYIGRLTNDKGLGVLAEALALPGASRFHLVTIGEAEDEACLPALRSLGGRWHQLPAGPDVTGVLAMIDVLCLPTRREGFPNVVLEAAAAGLPVVTTRATGARDSVLDGETGLLVGVDAPAELASALARLAEDPQLRARFGDAACERVRKEFVPQRIWDALEKTYRPSAVAPHE